jgi:pimeloyl-ACP methyl ester carboxylesterase
VRIPGLGLVARRGTRRLLAAPRTAPEEAGVARALDDLGGEVVRLRARDGLRLSARWLVGEQAPSSGPAGTGGGPPGVRAGSSGTAEGRSGEAWAPDPHEAVVLLHGWSGSVAPDLVEYGPFLRRTAGVLGLDLRGHGGSSDGPTTFGLQETEDVAGALEWLGERGVTRVALMGTSMGGIVAIAATAVLGEGTFVAPDADVYAPTVSAPPRPRIVGIVADSVTPELRVIVMSRLPRPGRGFMADRILDAAERQLGEDPRALEPIRTLPLLEGLPVLLIHGAADATVPPREARRLAAVEGPASEHWVVPGAAHSAAHRTEPDAYEARVTAFLRAVFAEARM